MGTYSIFRTDLSFVAVHESSGDKSVEFTDLHFSLSHSSPHELHGLLQGVGRVAAGVQHHGPQADVGQDALVRVDLVQGIEHRLHPLSVKLISDLKKYNSHLYSFFLLNFPTGKVFHGYFLGEETQQV